MHKALGRLTGRDFMNPIKSVRFLSCLPLILPDTGISSPIYLGGD